MGQIRNDVEFAKEFVKFTKGSQEYHPVPKDFDINGVITSIQTKNTDEIFDYLRTFKRYLDPTNIEDSVYVNKINKFIEYLEK